MKNRPAAKEGSVAWNNVKKVGKAITSVHCVSAQEMLLLRSTSLASNKCLALKELTTLEILTSEQTVHSAKCYMERDIGALEKPDKTCALVQGLGSFPRRGMWLSQLLVRTRNQLGQGS